MPHPTLEDVIHAITEKRTQDSSRLAPLADYIRLELEEYGLPGVRGGTGGELKIQGMARDKDWDVAYNFAGKDRLLISLKSMWSNASGTVPNRIDDLMGEAANVQQMAPEIVTGYVVIFDAKADSTRRDGRLWSQFFEDSVKRLTIRKAPLWNQGLLEGTWFIRIDSRNPRGSRVVNPTKAAAAGREFFLSLLRELVHREPAIPLTKPLP